MCSSEVCNLKHNIPLTSSKDSLSLNYSIFLFLILTMKILLRCFKVQLIILHVLSTSYLLFAMQNTFLMNYLPLTTCGCLSDHFFLSQNQLVFIYVLPAIFCFIGWTQSYLIPSPPYFGPYSHQHINMLNT